MTIGLIYNTYILTKLGLKHVYATSHKKAGIKKRWGDNSNDNNAAS